MTIVVLVVDFVVVDVFVVVVVVVVAFCMCRDTVVLDLVNMVSALES